MVVFTVLVFRPKVGHLVSLCRHSCFRFILCSLEGGMRRSVIYCIALCARTSGRSSRSSENEITRMKPMMLSKLYIFLWRIRVCICPSECSLKGNSRKCFECSSNFIIIGVANLVLYIFKLANINEILRLARLCSLMHHLQV
jgi:hypothetical protein